MGDIKALIQLQKLYDFVGKRVVLCLSGGAVAAIVVAIMDAGIAAMFHHFMSALQLVSSAQKMDLPFSVLRNLVLPFHIVCIVLVVAVFFRSTANFYVQYLSSMATEYLTVGLRTKGIYGILLNRPGELISSAEIGHQLGEISPKAASYVVSSFQKIVYAGQGFLFLMLMLFTAWKETSLALVGVFFLLLFAWWQSMIVRKSVASVPQEWNNVLLRVDQMARHWMGMRILGTARSEYESLSSHILQYARFNLVGRFWGVLYPSMMLFLGTLLLTFVVYFGKTIFGTEGSTLFALTYLFLRFILSLVLFAQQAANCSQNYLQFNTAWEIVNGSRLHDENEFLERKPTSSVPPEFVLQGVGFKYPGSATNALTGINLTIRAGQQVGIIGPSGSGKSTLVGLLLGVVHSQEGKIYLNNHEMNHTRIYQESIRVGFSGTDPFIRRGSVRENLKYGLEETVEEADYWSALERVGLKRYVEGLPGLLDYIVLENGTGLSTGQKHRLAFARIFLKTPQLIVLDEPSANLDDETEELITESLNSLKGKCTVIIASHRRGILRYADKVLCLRGEESNAPMHGINLNYLVPAGPL